MKTLEQQAKFAFSPLFKVLFLVGIALFLFSGSAEAFGKKVAKPSPAPAPEKTREFQMGTTYQAIQEYGLLADIQRKAGNGSGLEVIKSADGEHAYLVKKVKIQDADQLIRLMGAQDETTLSDSQKGLLGVYRYASEERIKSFLKFLPYASGSIALELSDVSGFEDESRYPKVRQDFWPRNQKTRWVLDGKTVAADLAVKMSPVDGLNSGEDTSKQMKSTFVHEYAHSFDLTEGEVDGYGADGSHYLNEIIKPKAAFIEGWAVFHQFLLDPSLEERYRPYMENVQIEGPASYSSIPANDPQISGMQLTCVESVVAFSFFRLSKEIPNGREKIYDAFKATNSPANSFANFLKTMIAQNPDQLSTIARILDQEARGKLSDTQLADFLGNPAGLSTYLANRGNAASGTVVLPPVDNGQTSSATELAPGKSTSESLTFQLPPQAEKTLKKSVKTNNPAANPYGE